MSMRTVSVRRLKMYKNIDQKIEMFEGRPDRDEIISQDDVLNLKIALEVKVPNEQDPLYFFLLSV